MLWHALTCIDMPWYAFTFYSLCKLSSSQDLVVGLVVVIKEKWRFINPVLTEKSSQYILYYLPLFLTCTLLFERRENIRYRIIIVEFPASRRVQQCSVTVMRPSEIVGVTYSASPAQILTISHFTWSLVTRGHNETPNLPLQSHSPGYLPVIWPHGPMCPAVRYLY